jgi:hypothetical protein
MSVKAQWSFSSYKPDVNVPRILNESLAEGALGVKITLGDHTHYLVPADLAGIAPEMGGYVRSNAVTTYGIIWYKVDYSKDGAQVVPSGRLLVSSHYYSVVDELIRKARTPKLKVHVAIL